MNMLTMSPASAPSARGRARTRPDIPALIDLLREDILSLRLKPGEVLARAELQERFGLSSTPVRDALLRLEEEGLVDIFPQHATIVSYIDVDLARQTQFLRRSLETECVRALAAQPAPELVKRMESLIRQQIAFDQVGEIESFNLADQAFHRAMFEAAGVLDLWLLMRRRSGHIERLRRLHLPVAGKTKQIIRDHQAIVAGITAGNEMAAEAALRAHLSHSLGYIETLRERNPDYFRK